MSATPLIHEHRRVPGVLTIDCPWCQQPRAQRCIMPSGRIVSAHRARWDHARSALISGRAVYEVIDDEEFISGELVLAEPYWLDRGTKITVIDRLNGKPDLARNLYLSQVALIDLIDHLADLDQRRTS